MLVAWALLGLAASQATAQQAPYLNVSLVVFDSGQAQGNSLYHATARVRSLESKYLPYLLKRTLEDSGHWANVWVLPAKDPGAEVTVVGKVMESDGTQLKLAIRVQDASNRIWLEQDYRAKAAASDYQAAPEYLLDTFQSLYDQVADDMAEALSRLTPTELNRILDAAMLRYAVALSPESFTDYLSLGEDGLVNVLRLPAKDDPIYTRVQRLRESEFLFADSLNDHYESLFHQVGETYGWWRRYSYELVVGNQALGKKDQTRSATKGTWYAMERIYHSYREAKMNEDALRELTSSFDQETKPVVARTAGKVVELGGTAAFQYEEWRRILRDIYRENTGF